MKHKLTVISTEDDCLTSDAKSNGKTGYKTESGQKICTNPQAHPTNKQNSYVEDLYYKHYDSLLRYLRSLLPADDQVFEILQETYIRLLKQESYEKLEANARAYLFTVATNLVRDCLRKRNSQFHDNHFPFDESRFSNNNPEPDAMALWEESILKLKKVLLELPTTTRQVFILHRFEQMTYPEIADALELSTRTVERHMASAVSHMRSSLGDFL